MKNMHNENMEKAYNRWLEKDFVEQLKGRVKRKAKEALCKHIFTFLEQEVLRTRSTFPADMQLAAVMRIIKAAITRARDIDFPEGALNQKLVIA